ncbi:TIM-barrel domain-containing protein [Limosilactobacillus sp.]|uniref:glycoside hydrolase family 31 protein n=1 Tax=Limosilactobacillus sp. TaxID=2773925 RepID=UPI00345E9157
MIDISKTSITLRLNDELLVVEAWGDNSIRVRDYVDQNMNDEFYHPDLKQLDTKGVDVRKIGSDAAELINGKISVQLDHRNRLTFYDKHKKVLLKEYVRQRAVKHDDGSEDAGKVQITNDFNSTLKLKPREFHPKGSSFQVIQRFESNVSEKIFGMGQYQQPFLNQKFNVLELAQRNSQISIPFYISSLGYGFLWNNPGIGKVEFAKNVTQWTMNSSDRIDYWITAGDSPKEITQRYTELVGRPPEMPPQLLGLWQSKLRYRTQDEVLEVANKYKEKGITPSVIAIDYFHWPAQGEYCFDKNYWPNPKQMISTLKKKYHIQPMVSVWPTVQNDARNYNTYFEKGYLVKINRGISMTMQIQGNTVFVDMTNPKARKYVWSLLQNNYAKNGIDYYWLDVAEPGYSVYDFDNYRYYGGTVEEIGNLYPNEYLRMVYEGRKQLDSSNPVVTLVRGAWIGAQKYGALVWSGDIDSSFRALRNQVNTGLNVGIAGIPWWTTDIGGFHGGVPTDKNFRELLLRWFEYATFSPILRLHGDRQPHSKPLSHKGGGSMVTGAPNEIWSYGKTVENILIKFLHVRESLRPYLERLMNEAHLYGFPIMRPLFYEFPKDSKSWSVDNTYMLGSDVLVAPIIYQGQTSRNVYLPKGTTWLNPYTHETFNGGINVDVKANIDQIPVFIKSNSSFDFSQLETALTEKRK